MTATATQSPTCPKCQGPVWDQKGGKFWGNGLTKNGKQKPRWECRDRECAKAGGAIWERESQAAPAPKAPAVKQPISYQNVPDASLPPLLRNQEQEDAAELASKLAPNGIPASIIVRREAYATAQLQTLQIALNILVPEYEKKEIGLTDDVIHKHAFELFKMWCDKGLIG